MSTYQHSIKFSKKQTLEFQNSSRPTLELYYHWSDSLMPTTAEIIQAGRLNFKSVIAGHLTRGKKKCNPSLQRNVEIASKKKHWKWVYKNVCMSN